ncbi:MAG TPA: hypothetical protein VF069_26560 [Streptosporangiaceae bacterium]
MIGAPESSTEGGSGARRRRRRPSAFSLTLTTITGIVLLLISVPNLGPAVRAGRAQGTPGTFVAAQRACVHHLSHESCSWRGTFTSQDGRDRRRDSYLYGDVALNPGQRIAAIDVGRPDRVYTGPSREWILTAGLLLLGAGLLLVPFARVLVRRS